jgi:hypothetical protein
VAELGRTGLIWQLTLVGRRVGERRRGR